VVDPAEVGESAASRRLRGLVGQFGAHEAGREGGVFFWGGGGGCFFFFFFCGFVCGGGGGGGFFSFGGGGGGGVFLFFVFFFGCFGGGGFFFSLGFLFLFRFFSAEGDVIRRCLTSPRSGLADVCAKSIGAVGGGVLGIGELPADDPDIRSRPFAGSIPGSTPRRVVPTATH